jgi:PAS domain S-box-containing protein
MSGTHADVTDRKQAEQALQESEARLRGLFELSPVGIALNDMDTGEFLEVNEALLAPTGYTRAEFVALSYWDITPREYEAQEALQLESMRKTGRYGPFEKEYIRKDGSRYPVLLNGMMVHAPSGRTLIWSIIEDISERKRIERMKNEFISTVSHELRTPLTAISGALGLMVGGVAGDLPGALNQMLDIAHKNSQRLGHLINDLLDMEKLVAGKMRFDMQIQSLMPLLEQAIHDNQAYADQHGARLVLKQACVEVRVEVDAQRLQQVLANLLSNAAKFSPEGSEVMVSAVVRHGRARVTVMDRGPGIPEEFREHIFEKFSQADASDTRQKGGSGLGLAITRELVERMGGMIGFDSMAGHGASFWFELPVSEQQAEADRHE